MSIKKLHPSVWLHFGAGIAIGLLFFLMPYYHFELGYAVSFAITLAASVIIASWKEWGDWKQRHVLTWKKWDWVDWLFTVCGSLTVPVIVGLIHLFI